MRLLRYILFLLFPILLDAQDQVTDLYSPRHNESFISITEGELEGEPITAYLDYRRLFIDYENEEIEDFYIAYHYACLPQNTMLSGKYFYVNSSSTLVFNLETREVYDHFTWYKGWHTTSFEETDGRLIIEIPTLESNRFTFGIYNPETKEKSISQAHDLVFSHYGELFYSDSTSSGQKIGEISIPDLSEEVIYNDESLVYLGDGIFRDLEGYLIENILDGNPTKTCIPISFPIGNLLATKIYVQKDYKIIETYNDSLSEYHYFGGETCEFIPLFSNASRIEPTFFNEKYFGFKALGKYFRVRYNKDFSLALQFTYSSNELYNISDRWLMSEDNAYFITRRFIDGNHEKHIYRYIPSAFFLDPDDKNLIRVLPDDLNIIDINADINGNLELTINSQEEGIYILTLDSEGQEINRVNKYYPIYHDHDAKNARWSSYSGGHLRIAQLKPTSEFRVDRLENGILLDSDTMLMQPYVDNDVVISLVERDSDMVLQFLNRNTSITSEALNPDINPSFSSRIIKIKDEAWLYTVNNTTSAKVLLKYGLDGSFIGDFNIDIGGITYFDDDGMIFTGTLSTFPEYIFHYDGNELKQLSDLPVWGSFSLKKGNKHYIFTFYQDGVIRLNEYNKEEKSLTLLESFTGHLDITGSESLHGSQQEDRVFSIFDNVDNSSDIENIIFNEDGYRVENFDFEEITSTITSKTFPINGGYVYSIIHTNTNVYVDSNGISQDIILDINDDLLIEDMLQTDESVYLFGVTLFSNYLIKCDNEFNDCFTIKDFNPAFCEYSFDIELLGRNNNEVYFSTIGEGPLQTIWTLDLSNDDVYHYNNDEETQIRFFERREFYHKGHVYFTAANSDQIDHLFRIPVSESPTAAKETVIENIFAVYPNPSPGNSTITSKIDLDQLSIYNSSGKEVASNKFDENRNYSLPNLASGYYIIQAKDKDGKEYISKLVVID